MSRYAVVVAGKGGRRSRAAREVADALAARGVRVGGFVQRTVEAPEGAKRIELERLPAGPAVPLARSTAAGDAAGPSACSLAFEPAAFAEARRWIEADAAVADVLVVDGLGKLELGGEGHRDAIRRALAAPPLVVLAVRDDQLVYALDALALEDEPAASWTEAEGPAALGAFVAEVARLARR